MSKIRFINKDTDVEGYMLSQYNKLSELGFPTFLCNRNELITKFYKLEEVKQDDHENHYLVLSSADFEWETYNCFATNVLLSVNDKLYVAMVGNDSVYVSDPLLYSQIDEIMVLGDETSKRMIDNIITVNQVSMVMLYNELISDAFKVNYPWVSDIEINSPTNDEIKLVCKIAKDSDRRNIKEFKLTIVKDFNFDSIQDIKVYVSVPCLELFTLVDDFAGYSQDVMLVKQGIQHIFTFVLSNWLYNLGIVGQEQLSKLNDTDLGILPVLINK